MTERPNDTLLEAWRDAEARGDDGAAEAALGSLFRSVPLEAPSPGFAAGTLALARARRAARAAEAPAPAATASRWAAAVLAVLSAGTFGLATLALALVPRMEAPEPVGWSDLVRGFHGLVVAAWEWIASGLALWSKAATWSTVMARVVALPEVAAALLAAVLLAALSLSLLRRILADERKLIHAETH